MRQCSMDIHCFGPKPTASMLVIDAPSGRRLVAAASSELTHFAHFFLIQILFFAVRLGVIQSNSRFYSVCTRRKNSKLNAWSQTLAISDSCLQAANQINTALGRYCLKFQLDYFQKNFTIGRSATFTIGCFFPNIKACELGNISLKFSTKLKIYKLGTFSFTLVTWGRICGEYQRKLTFEILSS